MNTLLSICIPTFNRAEELDRQLTWLAQEIEGFEAECEVIISDNCSEDATPEIVENWRARFAKVVFKANRNPENIGWMRNFQYLINAATGKYIWIVGDDDPIKLGTLAYVLKFLKCESNLSLIFLNFSDRDHQTGQVYNQHWLPTNLEEKHKNGIAVFEECLKKDIGAIIFITATIFRTEYVRLALQQWPASLDNWAGLAYWTGVCALNGEVLVTKESFVECTLGASNWGKNPRHKFYISYRDNPAIYKKLKELGFSSKTCDFKILELAWNNLVFNNVFKNIKYLLWCFKSFPKQASVVFYFYILSIIAALLSLLLRQERTLSLEKSQHQNSYLS